MAMKVSDLTRAGVLRTLETEAGERNRKAGQAAGVRKSPKPNGCPGNTRRKPRGSHKRLSRS